MSNVLPILYFDKQGNIISPPLSVYFLWQKRNNDLKEEYTAIYT